MICLCFFGPIAWAEEPADTAKASLGGVFDWVENYLSETNKPHREKAFDFSLLGGPHYSSDTKFGLGLVAAAQYRHDRSDTIMQPSTVALFSDISTAGFYMIGIRGTHFFPKDRFRLNYKTYFYSFPTKFWGIGYDNAINDDNETKYKHLQSKVQVEFLARIAPSLYLGPSMVFQYVDGKDMESAALWEGEKLHTMNVAAGISLTYDTRDYATAASKGVYVALEQQFFPRFLGNRDYNFSLTELTASTYAPVWKGGVLAMQIHGRFTYGHTPWSMLSTLGGSDNMRGYYDGRYRDKNEADFTVELRQNVYRRSGIVVWGGVGNIFPDFSSFKWSHTLPNYGIGYRWEFKKKMNVRLDLGFGRHTYGFVVSINEAF